jgi:hypothetical protein
MRAGMLGALHVIWLVLRASLTTPPPYDMSAFGDSNYP